MSEPYQPLTSAQLRDYAKVQETPADARYERLMDKYMTLSDKYMALVDKYIILQDRLEMRDDT